MSSTSSAPKLERGLSNRHIQLIAIGGAIGTGLFMGSGKTIAVAGPSVIFVYMIIGFMLFFVMRAMGELLLSNLNYKTFADFAGDLLGPWAAFFTGWTYWFCWVVTGIADVVAIAHYVSFWWGDLPLWIPGLACIALLLVLNLSTVKAFGETEFWFALVKIIAIGALIVVGLAMVITGFQHNGVSSSFSNLWAHGGMFPNGAMGFVAGFLDASGGGGWGPVATSTLLARGGQARTTIGTVNASEFVVTLTVSATFLMSMGLHHLQIVAGLLIGGMMAAPVAALLVKRLKERWVLIAVGVLVLAISHSTRKKAIIAVTKSA